MAILLNNCFEVIRKTALFSALDLPWQLPGPYQLTEHCMFFPVINSDLAYIQQTIARLSASIVIPYLTRPLAVINGVLGLLISFGVFVTSKNFMMIQ